MPRNYYVSGDHNLICDVCSRKIKASESRLRWDGFIVCKDDWEIRHPQDFVKARQDKITVPFSRPRPTDGFILNTPLTDSVTFPTGGGTLNYLENLADYFLEDYMSEAVDFSILLTWVRDFTDTVSITESSTALELGKPFADSVIFSESFSMVYDYPMAFSDSSTITESVTVSQGFQRSFTDSSIISDSVSVVSDFPRSFSDTTTPTEDVSVSSGFPRSLADTTTMSDSTTIVTDFPRTFSDTSTVTDAGSFFYNNYIDATYFASEYVGTTTTF